MNEKIAAVDQGLCYRVQIKRKLDNKINVLDRIAYYKIPGLSLALINNGAKHMVLLAQTATSRSPQSPH